MAVIWKMDIFNADAEKVYEDIEKIDDKTPQNIVDYAKENPQSELYKCFTWDDTIAANKWRKQEARYVICNLVYEEKTDEEKEPVTFRLYQKGDNNYTPVTKLVRNEDEYQNLLKRALAELHSFKERYKSLTELEEILSLIH